MKYSVKSLTMGAMCIAFNLLAVLIDRMLGGLSELVLLLVLALPICLYTTKYSIAEGIGVYIANTIACFFFSTPSMFIYAIIANLLGLWYGFGIKKKMHHGTLFGVNVIIMSLCYILTTILFASFFGYDMQTELESIETILHSFSLSMDSTQLMSFYIYITLWMSLLQSAALHLLIFELLKRFNMEHVHMHSILEWRLSKPIAWLFLFVLVFYFSGIVLQCSYLTQPWMLLSYMSVQLISSLFGAIICLILIPMRQKRLLILLLMVSLFIPVLKEGLMMVGLCDAWFDFRKKLR